MPETACEVKVTGEDCDICRQWVQSAKLSKVIGRGHEYVEADEEHYCISKVLLLAALNAVSWK